MAKYTSKFTGEEIDKRLSELDERIGYTRAKFNEQTTFYELESFASEEKAIEYDADPENNESLRLNVTVIPISTVQGDAYTAMLRTSISNTADIVVAEGKLEIPLNYRPIKITQIGNENAGYRGDVIIQRSTNGTTWTTSATIKNALTAREPDDATSFDTINIAPYLANGRQMVRIRASYNYTTEDGETKTVTSSNVVIGNSVTVTSLRLELRTEYHKPMSPTDTNGNEQPFSVVYGVFGSVQKTLFFKVDNGVEAKFPLSASVDSVNQTASIGGANYLTHGVHKVEAWLEAEDGLGNTIKSDVLVNRFMMVADTTNTKPYLLLQNVDDKIDNFVQTKVAEYAVYSPFEDEINVTFLLTSYSQDNISWATEYFHLEQKVKPNEANTLLTTIEIEEANDANIQPTYNTYFRVRREGSVDFMKESTGESSYLVIVDNTLGMTPVTGATFLLNPKVRNNNEDNPLAIYNAKDNNKEVDVVWTNADLINGMWQQAGDGQKVLRIMAGSKLEIKKDVWAKFRKNPASSLTFEIDCKISNVTNTTDPMIAMYSGTANSFRGLKMNALEGWLMTGTEQSKDDTLFAWDEDVRTHFSINISHQVYPNKGDVVYTASVADQASKSIALARVLVNGDCVREVKFDTTKADEWSTSDTGSIIIGNAGADIDIYSIRIYEDRQPDMVEILTRNYLSTLATSDEKTRLKADNDILDGGLISFEKCKQRKLNSMVWHGILPYHENPAEQTGWIEIERYDDFGNHLPDLSGTICKETKSLPVKGQGSTAKTYYDWNQQDDSSKVKYNFANQTGVILVDPKDIHESIVVSAPYQGTIDEKDTDKGGPYEGTIVDIYGGNLGKNFPLQNKARQYPVVGGKIMLPDGWIDGNGKYRGMGYMVAYGTALAQKRVIKINYASSMQSHLIGACKSYDLLHRKVVGNTPLQDVVPTAVAAKHTEPFMYFNQEGDGRIYFKGMGTYGAGKADKVAWGYVKKEMPLYALIEGSDNNLPMTGFRVPFDKNTAVYDCDGEGWLYNGVQNFDFDLGATETFSDATQEGEGWQFVNTGKNDGEVPSKAIRDRWAAIHNFVYLHGTNLKFFDGTFDQFKSSAAAQDTQYKYWFTQGANNFRLKRYDFINKEWVEAGLLRGTYYDTFSLNYNAATSETYSKWLQGGSGDYAALNEAFKDALARHMKKYIKYFFNEKSLQFNYCFVLGFLAGTDNSDKNTYYKIMPYAEEQEPDATFAQWLSISMPELASSYTTAYRVYMDGDDMDSIFRTNNNSHLTKPYYIDRLHPYADDKPTECLYEGMGNQLFNFVERAYENTHELSSMMNNLMVAATELIEEDDLKNGLVGGKSLWGFLNKYFFNIQRYFPKIAYLEQARIRYEFPELIGYVSSGGGARSIRPITQSLGSQLQAEFQYMNQRVIYMTSYAGFGAWGGDTSHSIGLDDANATLSFMPANMPDGSGATYTFTVKPHQYIYPSYFLGQTFTQTHKRTSPSQTCTFTIAENLKDGGDTGIGVCGVNYYTDLGDFGDKSISSAITISGKRLTDVTASQTIQRAFRPSNISLQGENLEHIDIIKNDSTGVPATIDLSKQIRLKTINVRGYLILRQVILPKSMSLDSAYVYAQIHMVDDVPNIKRYTPYSAQYIKELYIGSNVGNIDTKTIVTDIHSSTNPRLTSIHIENIDWKDFPIETLMWYANIPTCEFLGKIAIKEESELQNAVTWDYKNKLNLKFGNVDDKTSLDYRGLLITYAQRALTSAKLNGNFYNDGKGEYQLSVTPNSGYANTQTKIHYSIFNPQNVDCSIDAVTGVLSVNMSALPEVETFVDVIVRISRYYEGTRQEDIVETKQIKVYNRQAELGDLVYADGTFSSVDEWDETKTPIGVCFYVAPRYKSGDKRGDIVEELFNPADKQQRLMFALDRLTMTSKGGTTTTNPAWGVYKDQSDANGIFGTVDGTRKYLKLQSGQLDETTFYDIPTTTNLGSSGLKAGPVNNSASYIEEANFRDEVNEMGILNDGFLPIKAGTACGDGFAYEETAAELTARTLTSDLAKLAGGDYKAGDVVNSGYAKTLKIIEHRNKILSGAPIAEGMTSSIYQEFSIPAAGSGFSEMDSLAELLDKVAEWATNTLNDANPDKWKQLYYPVASMAYAYEPKVTLKQGEVLADRFKAHNWFLPSNGMLARIFWYQKLAQVNIFEKATTKGVFKAYPSSYYWSSTESNATAAWNVHFNNGNTGSYNKYSTYLVVGAVAAF